MIHLQTGQLLIDYDDICIMTGGSYNDADLVPFCYVAQPDVKVFEFQADYVKSRLREQ